jgi:hypothetical protein
VARAEAAGALLLSQDDLIKVLPRLHEFVLHRG